MTESKQLFRGFVETSYSILREYHGHPKIDWGKAFWTIIVKDKEYKVYDYTPLENSHLKHKWKVDSEFKDLSDL